MGQGVYELLERHRADLLRRLPRALEVKKILVQNPRKRRDVKVPRAILARDFDEILQDPGVHIVVEVMGGIHPAKEWVLAALEAGKAVVTANKALLATEGDAISRAADRAKRPLRFEAAVAGGIPLIQSIRSGLAGNAISALHGIVNGTSNYILSEMAKTGAPFEAVLQAAQKLGYAEADPRFDVDGIDAAHKLILLIRLAFGLNVHLDDLRVEGIGGVESADIRFARHFGYAVKPLVVAERVAGKGRESRLAARVHPALVPLSSLLSKVDGPHNAILIHGDAVGDLVFSGAGAGRYPTASAVLADVIGVAEEISLGMTGTPHPYGYRWESLKLAKVESPKARVGQYYLCFSVADKPGAFERIAKLLAQSRVSLASVYQPQELENGAVPIAILTHDTSEEALVRALKKIDSCGVLVKKSRRILVEALKSR